MPEPGHVYHVELRQFPHQARAFNVAAAELEARFVRPWVNGESVEYDDRHWLPQKAKIRILEGPEVGPAEMGLGRGWANAARSSEDITEAALAGAQHNERREIDALKAVLAELVAGGGRGVTFPDVFALAASAAPQARASEQLSTAEQAVWEMLHRSELEMVTDDGPVAPADWGTVVLSWETWTAAGKGSPRLAAPVPPLGGRLS